MCPPVSDFRRPRDELSLVGGQKEGPRLSGTAVAGVIFDRLTGDDGRVVP